MTFKPGDQLQYDGTDHASLRPAGVVTFLRAAREFTDLGPQAEVEFPDGVMQIVNVEALSPIVSTSDVSRETSPLRAAIESVLTTWAESDVWLGDDFSEVVDDLMAAVEQVPVKVTIRDLDMDPENILVVDSDELLTVEDFASSAHRNGTPLLIAVDSGDLKLKIGEGMWSHPIQTEVYEG